MMTSTPMAMTATAGYTLSSAPRLGTHLEANWPETGLARAWNLYHAGLEAEHIESRRHVQLVPDHYSVLFVNRND